ncbi:hypothetical protein B4135_1499 [Caldibacillus debilis]|uniref:Uncharacterized protein n=1 Tax=Caldibacillus debilis TaxID=301148 RepID=A0A150MC59_9BACI|nr:hypothetical protein B4135_1499 [Caldibacillus debilis]
MPQRRPAGGLFKTGILLKPRPDGQEFPGAPQAPKNKGRLRNRFQPVFRKTANDLSKARSRRRRPRYFFMFSGPLLI